MTTAQALVELAWRMDKGRGLGSIETDNDLPEGTRKAICEALEECAEWSTGTINLDARGLTVIGDDLVSWAATNGYTEWRLAADVTDGDILAEWPAMVCERHGIGR